MIITEEHLSRILGTEVDKIIWRENKIIVLNADSEAVCANISIERLEDMILEHATKDCSLEGE